MRMTAQDGPHGTMLVDEINQRAKGVVQRPTVQSCCIHRQRGLRLVVWAVCIAACSPLLAAQVDRQVAITIDDLPSGNAYSVGAAEITDMTSRLLAMLREQKIPAVGFVNEKKLFKIGEVDERIRALAMWLDSGFDLGNHTFSHTSLNRVDLKIWEDDVIQGETVTRLLLAQHNMRLRYFRHPYLETGRDLVTKQAADAFLDARGYRIAPVTVDAWDWMYAGVYEDARKRSDTALQQQLLSSYLTYTDAMFAYDEQRAKDLVGYEPKQILLLHANQLEADHLKELIEVIRKRGYRFITLEEALSDQIFNLPDTYTGEEGTDWLDHWSITRGKLPQGRPVFPAWVMERSEALHRPATAHP
jgi:peptidoglycan-N-acetylglucosamine deacetylase